MSVALRIKEMRLDAGMSKAELGRKVGVSGSAITQWESGDTKNVRPDYLLKAADEFGVKVEWLITGEHRKPVNECFDEASKGVQVLVEQILALDAQGTLSNDAVFHLSGLLEAFLPEE